MRLDRTIEIMLKFSGSSRLVGQLLRLSVNFETRLVDASKLNSSVRPPVLPTAVVTRDYSKKTQEFAKKYSLLSILKNMFDLIGVCCELAVRL